MALAEHLTDVPREGKCAYAKALDKLPPDDAATLRQWVDEGLSSNRITAALHANGTPLFSPSLLNNHRRGDCACA